MDKCASFITYSNIQVNLLGITHIAIKTPMNKNHQKTNLALDSLVEAVFKIFFIQRIYREKYFLHGSGIGVLLGHSHPFGRILLKVDDVQE